MTCRQVSNKNISLRIVDLNILAFFELDQIDHPKADTINKFILLHISFQKNIINSDDNRTTSTISLGRLLDLWCLLYI